MRKAEACERIEAWVARWTRNKGRNVYILGGGVRGYQSIIIIDRYKVDHSIMLTSCPRSPAAVRPAFQAILASSNGNVRPGAAAGHPWRWTRMRGWRGRGLLENRMVAGTSWAAPAP
jgi:hypothetical protein